MKYSHNTHKDYSLFSYDDNVLDNDKKVNNQRKEINRLQERVKDLEAMLGMEKEINKSVTEENLTLLFKVDEDRENLQKLLRYALMVAAIQVQMNDAVTGETMSEYVRFAFKFANMKYLEQLISLLPLSDADEDIAKVETYRDKLRQQDLLDNNDEEDSYTPRPSIQD